MGYAMSDWPVPPMEPVSRPDPFDNPGTLFQVKWDGVRALAYLGPAGSVRLFNRRLHERTAQYPELVEGLAGLTGGTALDGEIVAPGEGGRPDFPRVLQRDLTRSPSKIKALAGGVPVRYMVFDVLWLAGEPVYPLPLTRRLELLEGIGFRSPLIHVVESLPGTGRALFDAVKAEGMEGVVAKKADSPYRIGAKTDLWQKIKCTRTLTAVAGGYLEGNPARPRSLLLGVPLREGLRFVGAAASGVTGEAWRTLGDLFGRIPGPCPFVNPPRDPRARWIRPVLAVGVRFLEYTESGVLRAPVVTGFSERLP